MPNVIHVARWDHPLLCPSCVSPAQHVAVEVCGYLEVHGTYNLPSNCSYNPIISRVTVVMVLIFGL